MDSYLLGESLVQEMTLGGVDIGQNDCPVVFVGHSLRASSNFHGRESRQAIEKREGILLLCNTSWGIKVGWPCWLYTISSNGPFGEVLTGFE
jgi:hypothetical protein